MINQTKHKPQTPHTSKTRMRYRGPIESIKINNFKQDLSRDIIEIDYKVVEHHNSLKQYISETLIGSSHEVEIKQGDAIVFKGMDNVSTQVINHTITEGVL